MIGGSEATPCETDVEGATPWGSPMNEIWPDWPEIGSEGKRGWVFWVTGLSGSGKTTIGQLLFRRLRERAVNSAFLDGDVLRQVFGNDLGYTLEERRKCARRYSRISAMLAGQGLNVVIATISMFHECREWNRANLPRYFEIYLRVPRDILAIRRSPDVGANPERSQMESVVGWDLPFDEPLNPDLIIDNDGSMTPQEVADSIWIKVVASL